MHISLRELLDDDYVENSPMEAVFTIAAVMRTVVQGEPSTFEGECETLVGWTVLFGKLDQPANVRKLMNHISKVLDVPIPMSVLKSMMESQAADETNELLS